MADFFDIVETTIRDHKLGPDHASRTLGVRLERSKEKSNDYFEVLTSGRSQTIPELKSAEIRIERHSGRVKLILLGVEASVRCVTPNEVMKRFGTQAEFSPPTPRQPPESPSYYVYHHPWGDLRIGVSPTGRRCVEMVVTEFND